MTTISLWSLGTSSFPASAIVFQPSDKTQRKTAQAQTLIRQYYEEKKITDRESQRKTSIWKTKAHDLAKCSLWLELWKLLGSGTFLLVQILSQVYRWEWP